MAFVCPIILEGGRAESKEEVLLWGTDRTREQGKDRGPRGVTAQPKNNPPRTTHPPKEGGYSMICSISTY